MGVPYPAWDFHRKSDIEAMAIEIVDLSIGKWGFHRFPWVFCLLIYDSDIEAMAQSKSWI
jgi:hypothetical protein